MLHIICLTKSYSSADFACWYRYYRSFADTSIHVIDNGSSIDLSRYGDTYERVDGWPNQWVLFDSILNGNRYGFRQGDYVIFADDDEYFWFNNGWEKDIAAEFAETPLDILCVPQILVSARKLPRKRSRPYVLCNYYRRNDFSSQGKCIIMYNPAVSYLFNKDTKEKGHIPYQHYAGSIGWFRMSKVVGSGTTATTYGITAYDADIRLYHFHLKSEYDWKKKWERGSAACERHPYRENVRENGAYGGYDVIDTTVKNWFDTNQFSRDPNITVRDRPTSR